MSDVLWTPSDATVRDANLTRFAAGRGIPTGGPPADTYRDLWRWSVDEPDAFWSAVVDHFDVDFATPPESVLSDATMPGAVWFPGSTLNVAAHALRHADPAHPAVVAADETGRVEEIGWADLAARVAGLAGTLLEVGVAPGDRVVGYLPNIAEAVVAFLAAASVGAVWACCGPELGIRTVLDRFSQLEPVVLVAATGYRFGGRVHDRTSELDQLRAGLASLRATVVCPYPEPGAAPAGTLSWSDAIAGGGDRPEPVAVAFDHPLWVLFSSGTTGPPKGITHGQGGILVELLKSLALHLDVRAGDRVFWYTSTSWMMWNYTVAALFHGATVVCYDGSPGWPDPGAFWRVAERCGVTVLGTSAAYLLACRKAGVDPRAVADLDRVRSIGSTGSPLPADAHRWTRDVLGAELPVVPMSGGTDVCSCFVGGAPTLPVAAGEMACPSLGVAVEAWDVDGRPVIGEPGELVVTRPMPSMPLYLWGDADGSRYRDTYFDPWPGVWRHGDRITLGEDGAAVIHGRSDSTLNRFGVRIGTGEIYQVVDTLDDVAESLVIGAEQADGGYRIILFVAPAAGRSLDDDLREAIRAEIRAHASPRHVPDVMVEVTAVPHTLTGKKLEVPVKRLLQGDPLDRVVNLGAVDDPDLVRHYADLASSLNDPS